MDHYLVCKHVYIISEPGPSLPQTDTTKIPVIRLSACPRPNVALTFAGMEMCPMKTSRTTTRIRWVIVQNISRSCGRPQTWKPLLFRAYSTNKCSHHLSIPTGQSTHRVAGCSYDAMFQKWNRWMPGGTPHSSARPEGQRLCRCERLFPG